MLETLVADMRDDVAEIRDWVDELRQRQAAWRPIETMAGRVVLIALGAIVPVALAVVATWIRVALTP